MIMLPMCSRPIKISMTPARTVATARPSKPFFATMPATMEAKAAVGPAIWTLLPPKKEMMNPATMAVYRPCSGPTPEARARAMDYGRAMMATMTPATTSLPSWAAE